MILKENGTTTKLRRNTCAASIVAAKPPERGVVSPSFSRTKLPSVLAGEANLMGLATTGGIAVSRGGTC